MSKKWDDHDRMMICTLFYVEWKEFKSYEREVQKLRASKVNLEVFDWTTGSDLGPCVNRWKYE